MPKRRVVVTGMGMVSPVGLTVSESWQALLLGQSGIRAIQSFDCENFPTKIAGEVHGFDPLTYLKKKEARKVDPFIQYAIAASEQAMDNAKLNLNDSQKKRSGVLIGSGIGGLGTIADNNEALLKGGVKKVSPFFVPGGIVNMAAGMVSMRYGFRGPNLSIATACTSGLHSIGLASDMIAFDQADVMICGGAEAAVTPLGLAGFSAARALSTRNENPSLASRPWDRDRDGFVLADGAGVVILESLEHALERGATIYAELDGFGMSGDAYHMTSPPEDGSGAQVAMENALTAGRLDCEDIDYVNAHGTSTLAGDLAEARAIHTIFGDHCSALSVGSTKSMTGHLIGAAGAVETIFTILAVKHHCVPPTINLINPDEDCPLDFSHCNEAQSRTVNTAMCNSFGFGGTNASLIIKAYRDQ